jgi:hypothetical protein
MTVFTKSLFSFFLFIAVILAYQPVLAVDNTGISKIQEQSNALNGRANFGTSASLVDIISATIKVVFGLLALVFLVLIIIAGYQWMMANGNEETIKKSQSIIKNAIIGLVIVLSSYLVTYAIFNLLPLGINTSSIGSTTTGGGGSSGLN